MLWIYMGLLGFAIGLLVALVATPRVVEYVESETIEAPVASVYDAIRYQFSLMQWSAWPSTTGSACKVERNDGEVGAQTVFFDKKGQRFGYQEITQLDPMRLVAFKLESKGPPHVPTLAFHLVPIDDCRTQVILDFSNDISPPFHVLLRLFGVVKWTREMHVKDLDGLKRFCEPPHRTYTGEPAQQYAA
ncbi:MAG: SRPBCC family protein [Pseudomonadota bacterium]